MIINYKAYTIPILICLFNHLFADKNNLFHAKLFNVLHNNQGWELIADEEGISLLTKSIEGEDLSAYMVKQKISKNPHEIQNIIMDVKNYKNYFKGSDGLVFKEIMRKESWVDGYSVIPVEIPFVKNREYYFRIFPNGFNFKDTTSLVHWHILKPTNYEASDAILLEYGAGLWVAEKSKDGSHVLTYRLYMDPGGELPNFAINIINKMSIMNIFRDVLSEFEYRVNFRDLND